MTKIVTVRQEITVHATLAEEEPDRLDTSAQESGVPPHWGRVEAALDLVVQMGWGWRLQTALTP